MLNWPPWVPIWQGEKWGWDGNPEHWGTRLCIHGFCSRFGLNRRAKSWLRSLQWLSQQFPPTFLLYTSCWAVTILPANPLFTLVVSKGFALPTTLGVTGPKKPKRKGIEESFLIALKGILFKKEKLGWIHIREKSDSLKTPWWIVSPPLMHMWEALLLNCHNSRA